MLTVLQQQLTTATNAQGLTGTPSVVVGVATANSFSIGVGGTDVLTAINTKATTGKALRCQWSSVDKY